MVAAASLLTPRESIFLLQQSSTQTNCNQNSAKNTGIPPLLLLHQEVTEVQMLQYPLPVNAVRGPSTPTVLFIFKKERQTKNKPSPSIFLLQQSPKALQRGNAVACLNIFDSD